MHECVVLLMMQILHNIVCQKSWNSGSIVHMGSCRIHIINSSHSSVVKAALRRSVAMSCEGLMVLGLHVDGIDVK